MGMKIDEAIRRIDEHNYMHQRKEPRAIYISEALDMAVDIMRKYKKIQTIVKAWNDMNSFDSMVQISEVIANENNK